MKKWQLNLGGDSSLFSTYLYRYVFHNKASKYFHVFSQPWICFYRLRIKTTQQQTRIIIFIQVYGFENHFHLN